MHFCSLQGAKIQNFQVLKTSLKQFFFFTRYIKILWRFHIFENFFVSTESGEDMTIFKLCRWVKISESEFNRSRCVDMKFFFSDLDPRWRQICLVSPSSSRKKITLIFWFFLFTDGIENFLAKLSTQLKFSQKNIFILQYILKINQIFDPISEQKKPKNQRNFFSGRARRKLSKSGV